MSRDRPGSGPSPGPTDPREAHRDDRCLAPARRCEPPAPARAPAALGRSCVRRGHRWSWPAVLVDRSGRATSGTGRHLVDDRGRHGRPLRHRGHLVAVTAAGGLVEFRYQVVDPDKANPRRCTTPTSRPTSWSRTPAPRSVMSAPPHHHGAELQLGRDVLLPDGQRAQRAAPRRRGDPGDRRRPARAPRGPGMTRRPLAAPAAARRHASRRPRPGRARSRPRPGRTASSAVRPAQRRHGRRGSDLAHPVVRRAGQRRASTFELRTLDGTASREHGDGRTGRGGRSSSSTPTPLAQASTSWTGRSLSLDDGHPSERLVLSGRAASRCRAAAGRRSPGGRRAPAPLAGPGRAARRDRGAGGGRTGPGCSATSRRRRGGATGGAADGPPCRGRDAGSSRRSCAPAPRRTLVSSGRADVADPGAHSVGPVWLLREVALLVARARCRRGGTRRQNRPPGGSVALVAWWRSAAGGLGRARGGAAQRARRRR